MDQAATAVAPTIRGIELRALLDPPEHRTRDRVRDTLRRLEESYGMTVRALSVALELRDDDTGHHAERVCRVARELAWRVAPPELLRDPELEHGFLVHDLGKIGIPDAVLTKRGPLDRDEWP